MHPEAGAASPPVLKRHQPTDPIPFPTVFARFGDDETIFHTEPPRKGMAGNHTDYVAIYPSGFHRRPEGIAEMPASHLRIVPWQDEVKFEMAGEAKYRG
ncbi:MAG: hypothetical protein Q9P14_08430 [candidate division KSB1 bacterium]|nr:hypothetical protein [candidate division KSB1 bacterium]MDQ7065792.1 hypothetical protein [candidate division KSB1 bacterium]